MEQQTISIAKAGITTVLNSRCSVLAAANPIYGRYDDTRSTSENIDFLPSILSRFDLIFIVRDIRDYNRDIEMAKNVMNIHVESGKELRRNEDIPMDVMKRYIAYCRAKCSPRLNEEASEILRNHYVSIREEIHTQSLADGSNPSVPIAAVLLMGIHLRRRYPHRGAWGGAGEDASVARGDGGGRERGAAPVQGVDAVGGAKRCCEWG